MKRDSIFISDKPHFLGDIGSIDNSNPNALLDLNFVPGEYNITLFNSSHYQHIEHSMFLNDVITNKDDMKLIGSFVLDSGTYILTNDETISSWITEEESKVVGVRFWGRDSQILKEKMQERDYNVIEEKDTMHLIQSDRIEAEVIIQVIQTIVDEYSLALMFMKHMDSTFNTFCDLALNSDEYYAIKDNNFIKVSNHGDGHYKVYGYLNELEQLYGLTIACF